MKDIEHRRLATVSLSEPISHPTDRNEMPMSTLIASDQWLLEVAWDGSSIGDVQIFKNASCGQNGAHTMVPHPKKLDERGKPLEVPKADEWKWWGAVPHGRIKSYRFHEDEHPQPMTVGLPFELPNAQRKAKPDEAGSSSTTPA
jgi:hypothetical protein